jgi:hypothetical protein
MIVRRGHDEHRAACDPDQARRHTAEKGSLERATPSRADDDQFGCLLLGRVREALSCEAEGDAPLGSLEPGVVGNPHQ